MITWQDDTSLPNLHCRLSLSISSCRRSPTIPQVPPAFAVGPANGTQWDAWWANDTTTFCALATKEMMLITPDKATTHYLPCREGGESRSCTVFGGGETAG